MLFFEPDWRPRFGVQGAIALAVLALAAAMAVAMMIHFVKWVGYWTAAVLAYAPTADALEATERQCRLGEQELTSLSASVDHLGRELADRQLALARQGVELAASGERCAMLQEASRALAEQNAVLRDALLRYARDQTEYTIEEVKVDKGDVYLVLAKPAGRPLQEGRHLTVIDRTDGAALGLFAISEAKRNVYYVRQVGNIDAVWNGYLQLQATGVVIRPPPNAAAFLMPEQE